MATKKRLHQTFDEVQAILDAVGQKVDKIEGKGLSANDYTDQDKNKLASVEEDAQENVIEVIEADGVELPIENKTVTIPAHKQSDWSQNDSSGKDYIKNRTHWEENGVVHKLHPKFLDMDASPTSGSTKPVMSGGVKEALDGKQEVIGDLADIRHGAGLGETAYQKPSAGIPASDLASGVIPDVSSFITRTVNDLANYYLKSETYTKEEVAALIGAIRQFHYEVYAALPATGEGNVLYLIGPTGSGSDKYEEYVYANNGWVKIGDTSMDLSGYVTIEALNQALSGYVTSAALATALTGKVGSETIHNIVELTQAEYDALQTKRDDTMYIITDTTKVYIGSTQIEGTDGKSAYQSWLDQGNIGTEEDFLDSLVGPQGEQGATGPQGPQGPMGPAGTAVDLSPLVESDATFTERAVTPQSGVGRVPAIKGKSVVWNQMFRRGQNTVVQTWDNKGVGTIAAGDYPNGTIWYNQSNNSDYGPLVSGHKYFVLFSFIGGSVTSGSFYIQAYNLEFSTPFLLTIDSSSVPGQRLAGIITYANKGYFITARTANTVIATDIQFSINLIDLTLMFGEAGEPSTVADFEALYPLGHYDADAGTLVNNAATGLQTRDGDENVVDTLPLNLTTLTGKLNGEGSSVTVFPEGLRSAGKVYDEISGNKAYVRFAEIDLGTLTWRIFTSDTGGNSFVANVANTGIKSVPTNATRANLMCSKYLTTYFSTVAHLTSLDKVICQVAGPNRIIIHDTGFSDASVFAAAMSGVKMVFELATPLEYILDEPLDTNFDTGATEQRLPADTASSVMAPFRADMQYGLKTKEIIGKAERDAYDIANPAVGSSQPSGGFLPNVFYALGELAGDTTFTLAAATDNTILNHYYWTFDTPSTAPTITWPTGLTWVGGSAPTVAASKHYEVSVINGIAAYMEA